MVVPVMGTSTLPTEMISCEYKTEGKSTLFTSAIDFEIGEEGFSKPSLCFTSSKASIAACAEAAVASPPPSLPIGVSSMPHDLLEDFCCCASIPPMPLSWLAIEAAIYVFSSFSSCRSVFNSAFSAAFFS